MWAQAIYWSVPEISGAVKNQNWSTTPSLFTPKSEIITRNKPLEGIDKTCYEDVINGKKSSNLPMHLKVWVKEPLNKCLHMDPSAECTIREIADVLEGEVDVDDECFFELHFLGT